MLASEWAPFNVRVNTLCPGLVKTQFSRAMWDSEDVLKHVLDSQRIKRLADPSDIAGAVLFLASDEAKFITGTELVIDGGYTAR
jgi:NAD(P)-dependent dehydrogenase (short-subunit alcohol dehydrogenase family)